MSATSGDQAGAPHTQAKEIVAASEERLDQELARRVRVAAAGFNDADCAGLSRPMIIEGLAWIVLGCALWLGCVLVLP